MAEPALPVPPGTFPPHNFPVAFADGVLSIANSPANVKFYLFRFEPEFAGGGKTQMQPFVQVVMPMDNFAATFAFFEAAVQRFISQGYLTQARLEEHRKVSAQIAWKT